jgi:transcriptional regulator with XRE-family HTH domain
MARRWSHEEALRFFVRTCPQLLELGAIAYWTFSPAEYPAATRQGIEQVTQCVLAVGRNRVRIVKAEGRSAGVEGTVFGYGLEDGTPRLSEASAAARLGAALRALRVNRGLSQSEVARLAGVSPSAVSQAERGQRGLSLETLLQLTGRIGLTIDELLRGEISRGYRLARRYDPHERADGRALPLIEDPSAGLRAYLVRLAPGSSGTAPAGHKGVELVAVASGLVQLILASGRPVLRAGETCLAERAGVQAWRNLGDEEAMLFWVVRDEPVRPAPP